MPVSDTSMADEPSPKKKRKPSNTKSRLAVLDRLDGRTQAYRDAVVLIGEYEAYMRGVDNDVDHRAIAEIGAFLRGLRIDTQYAYVKGEPVNKTEACTLANAELRAINTMREARAQAGDNAMDLTEYLKQTAKKDGE